MTRADFQQKTLPSFFRLLGSQAGAPGGGAAAALTGAAGAAIVEMVGRLNDKRLGRSSGAAKKAAALCLRLQKLIAEDAQAFERIQKYYKTRKTKPAAWQAALKNGAKPPLAIAEACAAAAPLAKSERFRTSSWLESDRREALILLGAAFRAAALNVEVNLKGIRDQAFNASVRRKLKGFARRVR